MNSHATQNSEAASDAAAARVQPVKFGHSNIYLVKTQTGHILVDGGMPDTEEKLDTVFEEYHVDPNSVQLIIATHGHLDHVGSIAYAQKVSGGKVMCHRAAAEYLMRGTPEPATPRNLLGRFLNLLTSLSGSRFDAVRPDILVEDEFELTDYGISGKVVHTPGHSPSSVSILLDSGEALIGDLIRDEGAGRIGFGMFYEDEDAVLDSLEKIARHEPQIIHLSHGTTIDNTRLRDFIVMHRRGNLSRR